MKRASHSAFIPRRHHHLILASIVRLTALSIAPLPHVFREDSVIPLADLIIPSPPSPNQPNLIISLLFRSLASCFSPQRMGCASSLDAECRLPISPSLYVSFASASLLTTAFYIAFLRTQPNDFMDTYIQHDPPCSLFAIL